MENELALKTLLEAYPEGTAVLTKEQVISLFNILHDHQFDLNQDECLSLVNTFIENVVEEELVET